MYLIVDYMKKKYTFLTDWTNLLYILTSMGTRTRSGPGEGYWDSPQLGLVPTGLHGQVSMAGLG